MTAALPDLVRLTVPVAFASLAIRDYHTRRVPRSEWPFLAALGVALLPIEAYHVVTTAGVSLGAYAARVGVSIVVVGGIGIGLYLAGAWGMADAKALLVLSILLPTTPAYSTPLGTLPLAAPPLDVLSLAVVSNSIVLAGAYPLAMAARNLRAGRFGWRSFVARPAPASELPELHGQVGGLDLDVLRAYFNWSDTAASELGRVDEEQAAAFLSEYDGPTYGATAADLRDGVNAVAENRTVWVTPGVPFLVPIFAGVVSALTVGDLLALLF